MVLCLGMLSRGRLSLADHRAIIDQIFRTGNPRICPAFHDRSSAKGSPTAPGVTGGRLDELPETIVQFGEGAFLRGFADWMVDIANEKGLMRGSIAVVPPVRDVMADPIEAQDGLYTLLLRGMMQGQEIEERRIVSSIRRAIRPHSQWNELVACFRSRPLRFVISNTTEAGICYVDEPYRPA